MSNTSKHTPTPWSAPSWAARNGRHGIYGAGRATAGYAPIAFVKGDKRVTGADGAADAAFIVRACNAHEQLVAALKKMIPLAAQVNDIYIGPHPHQSDELEAAINAARAALAAAEA